MRSSRVIITIVIASAALVSACRQREERPPPPRSTTSTEPTRPGAPPEPRRDTPDVALAAPMLLNVDELRWQPGPESLPQGAQMLVLEGAPPFPADRAFT